MPRLLSSARVRLPCLQDSIAKVGRRLDEELQQLRHRCAVPAERRSVVTYNIFPVSNLVSHLLDRSHQSLTVKLFLKQFGTCPEMIHNLTQNRMRSSSINSKASQFGSSVGHGAESLQSQGRTTARPMPAKKPEELRS